MKDVIVLACLLNILIGRHFPIYFFAWAMLMNLLQQLVKIWSFESDEEKVSETKSCHRQLSQLLPLTKVFRAGEDQHCHSVATHLWWGKPLTMGDTFLRIQAILHIFVEESTWSLTTVEEVQKKSDTHGIPFSEGVAGAEMTEGMVKRGGVFGLSSAEDLEREGEKGRKGDVKVGGRWWGRWATASPLGSSSTSCPPPLALAKSTAKRNMPQDFCPTARRLSVKPLDNLRAQARLRLLSTAFQLGWLPSQVKMVPDLCIYICMCLFNWATMPQPQLVMVCPGVLVSSLPGVPRCVQLHVYLTFTWLTANWGHSHGQENPYVPGEYYTYSINETEPIWIVASWRCPPLFASQFSQVALAVNFYSCLKVQLFRKNRSWSVWKCREI